MRIDHLGHHYASVLIDGGERVKVVRERLGHASAAATLRTCITPGARVAGSAPDGRGGYVERCSCATHAKRGLLNRP